MGGRGSSTTKSATVESLKNWVAPKSVSGLVNNEGFRTELSGNALKVTDLIVGKTKKIYTNVRGFSSMQGSQRFDVAKLERAGKLTPDERNFVFLSDGNYYLIKKGKGTQKIGGKSYSASDKIVKLT